MEQGTKRPCSQTPKFRYQMRYEWNIRLNFAVFLIPVLKYSLMYRRVSEIVCRGPQNGQEQ